VRTANALIAVHTLLKPYKYFLNPGVNKVRRCMLTVSKPVLKAPMV